MEVRALLWDESNEAHIARHRVRAEEVEQVVSGEGAVFAVDHSHRRGRLIVFGVTGEGRYLFVALDEPTSAGDAYVLTARPMTDRERRDYETTQGGAP